MKQGGNPSGGFTIVETLIVLAVTGSLFVMAAVIINGRQTKTEFQVGIHDFQESLQQIVNETASGYYPNNNDFKCASGTPPVITSPASNAQGTNEQCIFLGKILYFGPGQANTNFELIPIAGNRLTGGGDPVTTMAQAWPVAITPSSTSVTLESGLSYVGANSDTTGKAFAIGILSSLVGGASITNSGAPQFHQYLFDNQGSWATGSMGQVLSNIGAATTSVTSTHIFAATNDSTICIASGGTNESGLFTITPSFQVALVIKPNKVCA